MFDRQKVNLICIFKFVKSSLSLKNPHQCRHLKQFDESNRLNIYHWTHFEWNQWSLRYSLKKIDNRNRTCFQRLPYPFCIDFKGLGSFWISLIFMAIYTWKATAPLQIEVWRFYCPCWKYTQHVRIFYFRMRFYETFATMQSMFTWSAVTNKILM